MGTGRAHSTSHHVTKDVANSRRKHGFETACSPLRVWSSDAERSRGAKRSGRVTIFENAPRPTPSCRRQV